MLKRLPSPTVRSPTLTALAPPPADGSSAAPHRCGNCEAVLHGPYCAQCGQHAHASARNLAAVVHDAWHDITHVDGRVWHTLWLLLARPGQLTVDYFAERRARYLPPVRLYLVVSVLFFAIAVGGAGSHHPLRLEVGGKGATAVVGGTASGKATGNDRRDQSPCRTAPAGCAPKAASADKEAEDKSFAEEIASADCSTVQSDLAPWLEHAMRHACERMHEQGAAGFEAALRHAIPRMMFVFLPLVALTMKLLYWRPRRYYVEHLVYLLHNHSALFLWFSLVQVANLLLGRVGVSDNIGVVATLAYISWYPYSSMRRYYGQGRLLTLGKYCLLSLAYLVFLGITFAGAAIFAALLG